MLSGVTGIESSDLAELEAAGNAALDVLPDALTSMDYGVVAPTLIPAVIGLDALLNILPGEPSPMSPGAAVDEPTTPSPEPSVTTVSISFTDSDLAERKPTSSAKNGKVRVDRGTATSGSLTIGLDVSPGGKGIASEGSDFSAIPNSVTINDGQSYVEFDLIVKNDTEVEGNELVVIGIASSTSFTIGTGSAQATIKDNDFWEWDDPSATPGVPQFRKHGFFSDSTTWSDGSELEMSGQVRVAENSVGVHMTGSFTEENSWLGPTHKSVNDSVLIEFDFDKKSGEIFLKKAGAVGGTDREDGPLEGGIAYDFAIDTPDKHRVTVNIGRIGVIAGGTINWGVNGGLNVQDPKQIVNAGVSASYSSTESWSKSLRISFATTLSVKQVEQD